MKKQLWIFTFVTALLALMGGEKLFAAALQANATYSITIKKIGSDGIPVAPGSTTSATTDANGKLSFNLSSVPTNADANFLLFQIKDVGNAVVKQAIVPAPPASDKNFIGINDMSDIQANALLTMLSSAQSDDPIIVSFGFLMLRNSNAITNADATTLGQLGAKAVIASGNPATPSIEEFLTGSTFGNISSAKVTRFKQCLVYNNFSTAAGKAKSVRDFSKGFYTANESATTNLASQEIQKAGGLMADIFMDAGICAGIPAGKILASHNAAGDVAQPIMAGLQDTTLLASINQAMNGFHQRIALTRVAAEYTKALTALGASGTQMDTFLAAVKGMAQANSQIEADYGWFFDTPTDANAVAHGKASAAAVQAELDARWSQTFDNFRSQIQSSTTDITTMRTLVKQKFTNVTDQNLDQIGFGKFYDQNGAQTNWPIPQTVMVTWVLNKLIAGGTFSYTRDTTTIPDFAAAWLGNCLDGSQQALNYYDPGTCAGNGGIWTKGRHSFAYLPAQADTLKYFLGLQEDVNIIEMNRYAMYQNGNRPSSAVERAERTLFENRMANLKYLIVGTKDVSGTPFTDVEKGALVKLIMQPSTD